MHNVLHLLSHATLHTLGEVGRLIPFLFLSYLLMEFMEHRSGNLAENWLRGSGRVGPLVGGVLGMLPQCGFSTMATGLYAGRILTVGTLIAVYLSTSDEMLAILISHTVPVSFILKILGVKLAVGVLAGFFVDAVFRLLRRRRSALAPTPQIEELCEREHCKCGEHFLLSAVKHTAKTLLFIFLVTFLLNLTVEAIGEERLGSLLLNRPVLGNLLAAFFGLIPNCAPSVILTELHLGGVLSVGAMLSGLLVNAGVGTALLLRTNRPIRDSLRILLILLCVGTAVGILIDLTPLAAFLAR
jgi:hypothetical protein